MKSRNKPSFPKAGGGGTVGTFKPAGMYHARRNNTPVLQVPVPLARNAPPVQGKYSTDAVN